MLKKTIILNVFLFIKLNKNGVGESRHIQYATTINMSDFLNNVLFAYIFVCVQRSKVIK